MRFIGCKGGFGGKANGTKIAGKRFLDLSGVKGVWAGKQEKVNIFLKSGGCGGENL